MPNGICYLVGAGPGDPLLFTLKGRDCLAKADVVVCDHLANPALLQFAGAGAEIVHAGKKAGDHTMAQAAINQLLVERTQGGATVVRLKGGDPFLFGRGGEEAEALAEAGCAFEVVPGVTSAIAGPAYAGIPVTHRAHNTMLTIFTGHEDPGKSSTTLDYGAIARAPGTKVMLMGIERLQAITENLMAAGMSPQTPVALVRWATTGQQKTLCSTAGEVAGAAAKADFKPPAVAVFGEVVDLRGSLNWFESLPLFGRRIAVTRTRRQGGELAARLRSLGADAYEVPTIRIEPAPDKRAFYEAVAYAHGYDWLVLTSPNGADAFFEAFFEIYKDARDLGAVRIAAIGPATAARVRSYRFQVDAMPERFLAGEIAAAMEKETSIENLKVLLARASGADGELPAGLSQRGAIVDDVVAYRTMPETGGAGIQRYRTEGADLVTFTSASTAENFQSLALPEPKGVVYASIGPVTSRAMREQGLAVGIEASRHDIPGLVEAIVAFFKKTHSNPHLDE